jgi:tetratricopeptide (TPR) repeat protein/TolB-like protein
MSRLALAAIFVIGVVFVALWLQPWRRFAGTEAPPRLAVMPFELTPASDGADLLGLGLAALLSDRLGQQLSNVRVLAAADTRGWPSTDGAEATRRLGSTHVVSGRVARDNGRTRITADVFSSADGRVIAIEPLEIPGVGGSIEDAIVSHLVPRIAAALALAAPAPARRHASANTQANQIYLTGRALVLRPDAANLKQAASCFTKAIDLDPDFADAWAGLASAYKRMPITGAMPSKEAFPLADKAARKALELDSNSAEAHAALGTKAFWYDWNYALAEQHLKHAIELQRSHADSHLFLGHLYSNIGRPEEALDEIHVTRELDRQWPQSRALEGQFLTMARRYDEARDFLESVTTVTDPELWTGHAFLAEALLGLDRPADAMAAFDRASQLRANRFHHAQRGYFLARLNRIDDARAALASAPPEQNYARALVHLALGQREEAVSQLHLAVDDKNVMVTFLGVDPRWDSLRTWEPFRDVVRRVNLLEVSERTAARFPATR